MLSCLIVHSQLNVSTAKSPGRNVTLSVSRVEHSERDGGEREQMDDFHGLISDAMGHLRDGLYERAESILEGPVMALAEKLPEPERSQRCAWLLRKLSVIFEYQDRVDECHDAWTRADALERRAPYGSVDKLPGWQLSAPPSSPGSRRQGRSASSGQQYQLTTASAKLERGELARDVAKAVQDVSNKQLHRERQNEANERFIASVLSMAREDTQYASVRRVLTAGRLESMSRRGARGSTKKPHSLVTTAATAGSPPSSPPSAAERYATSTTSSHNSRRSSRPASPKSSPHEGASGAKKKKKQQKKQQQQQKKKKKKKKKQGGVGKKEATIDELKKIVRSDPELAGICALRMARRYFKIRQPKKSLSAYRKALSKELQNFARIVEEQRDLEENWRSFRGMKEKREGEEKKYSLLQTGKKVRASSWRCTWACRSFSWRRPSPHSTRKSSLPRCPPK